MNAHLAEKNNKLSINDFIIKSCALALQSVPTANAIWAEDKILQLKPSDIAVAVSVEDGLFTPVIRDADTKSLSNISKEMKELADREEMAKIKALEAEENLIAKELQIKEMEEEMNLYRGGMAFGKGGMYKGTKKTYGMRKGGFTNRGQMS